MYTAAIRKNEVHGFKKEKNAGKRKPEAKRMKEKNVHLDV